MDQAAPFRIPDFIVKALGKSQRATPTSFLRVLKPSVTPSLKPDSWSLSPETCS